MKVLHILNSAKIGGIERFVYFLTLSQLKIDNLDVHILLCNSDGALLKEFEKNNIDLYKFEIKNFDLNLFRYLDIIRLSNKFDVIHIHSFKPIRDFLLLTFSKSNIVYTNHSVFGFGRTEKITNFLRRKLFKVFLNNNSCYKTYNSDYTKEFWESIGVNKRNSCVIENGVIFNDSPKKLTKNDISLNGKFIIGTSSRFITWKRVDYLIRAFYLFSKDKKDVHLLLVGDGDQRQFLEELVIELNISEKITFLGFKKEVEQYQNIFDVCVFPSTTESFGLVAVECMSLGKPVLVMEDGGGITEIVRKIDPENISKNVEDLSIRMDYYYDHFLKYKSTYNSDRVKFSKSYNMDIKSLNFFDLYKRLLK